MAENSSGKRPHDRDDDDRSSKRAAVASDTVFRLLVGSKKVMSLVPTLTVFKLDSWDNIKSCDM